MRALLFPGDRRVEIADLPDPVPGEREVLLEIRYSAICGTDLHDYRLSPEERAPRAHMVPGHEPVGVVRALGPGVQWPAVGDRVVAYHLFGCHRPECAACRTGMPRACRNRVVLGRDVHGSNAELQVVPAINCLPLPDDFDFAEGVVLSCNFGTAFAAMRRADASGRSTIAVFGLGPVGLCAVVAGAAMGATIIGLDIVPERLELARKVGAETVIDAGAGDPVAEIMRLTGGYGADAAVETSGASAAQTNALNAIRKRGKLIVVGVGINKEWTLRPREQVMAREVCIQGSHGFEISDWEPMLAFLRRHRLKLASIVGATYASEQAAEAFRQADAGHGGKILIRWK